MKDIRATLRDSKKFDRFFNRFAFRKRVRTRWVMIKEDLFAFKLKGRTEWSLSPSSASMCSISILNCIDCTVSDAQITAQI